MKAKVTNLLVLSFILAAALPAHADKKRKTQADRAMIEKMDAVPCGAKQKGVTGLGSIWASVGITHMSSDEKLCPRYLLLSDNIEYEIQPTNNRHPAVLPVGQEVIFRIKKDHMTVKCPEGDRKSRTYEVVAMKPTEKPTDAESQSPPAKPENP
ncbi:MAG TPA: hypothetical protein VEJ67_17660 [Candidatus Cybelea sp.]|nr:hypothetical protein [Candidatus Cybelea sp.]